MMNEIVEKSIYELLLTEDIVILPHFGGFVVNYKPAFFDETKAVFYPPKREIGFNGRLQHDDGVLTARVAVNLSTSYEQAKELITTFIATIHETLNAHQRFELNHIGYFEKRNTLLQFVPAQTNFLLQSYGLDSLYVPKTELLSNKPQVTDWRESYSLKKWLAVAGLVISMALLPHNMFQNQTITSETNVMDYFSPSGTFEWINDPLARQISNELDRLVDKKNALSPLLHVTKSKQPSIIKKNIVLSKQIAKKVRKFTTNETKALSKNEIKSNKQAATSKIKKKEMPKTVLSKALSGYYLIVGSFKDKNNALKFFNKTKRRFPDAVIIDYKGFYRISVNLFSSRKEAVKIRKELTNKGVSNWLMHI